VSVEVHSFTPSHILKSMKCDSYASLLAHTFASPYLDCKPKAKVATQLNLIFEACLKVFEFEKKKFKTEFTTFKIGKNHAQPHT
jgi:hypothetical protein